MSRSREDRRSKSSGGSPVADGLVWANLVHLSYNMWRDREAADYRGPAGPHLAVKPYLRCESKFWSELVRRMTTAGINMVVIDLGDGLRYDSHPEIAVRRAWTPSRLRRELARLREAGIEPIPKLNFATTHDAWLGPYSRCVSTDAYYAVCRDLIAEVIELFERPRLFHLGMDEETYDHQRNYRYVVVRQFDLWWHDLLYLVEQVERAGVRAWVWSDAVWRHPDEFYRRMPRSVLQSNWYYGDSFSRRIPYVKAYLDLDRHGYDQVPTGSNWRSGVNFERTVRFSRRNLTGRRLLGFLQTTWMPTLQEFRRRHAEALHEVGAARRWWEGQARRKGRK